MCRFLFIPSRMLPVGCDTARQVPYLRLVEASIDPRSLSDHATFLPGCFKVAGEDRQNSLFANMATIGTLAITNWGVDRATVRRDGLQMGC